MRIDDHDVVLIDDDGRIRPDVQPARAERAVDARLDHGERVGRIRRRGLRADDDAEGADREDREQESETGHCAILLMISAARRPASSVVATLAGHVRV